MRSIVAVFILATLASAQTTSTAGRVAAVIPSTSIFRSSGAASKAIRTAAVKDQRLEWNDIVRTERSGRARLQLEDQSILTLGSNSTLRVVKHDSRSQQTALELGYGRIRCQIRQITSDTGRFELRTPTAVAGVIGTDFGADSSDPDETKFVCVNGAVRVRSSNPIITAFTDCTAGMSVSVKRGQAPGAAVPATPEQLERWQHITEPGDEQFAQTIPPVLETPGAAFNLRGRDPFPWLNDTAAGRLRWRNFDFTGSLRFRAEGWDFFDAPAGVANADDSYGFGHSTLKFAVTQNLERVAWSLEITQPALFGLPEHSIAAAPQGQLGLGATYFAANGGSTTAAYIFPSQLWIKFRGLGGDPRNELTLGRMRFIDGAETKPANSTVGWLKRVRIAHRLLGDFGFANNTRSEDGVALSLNRGVNNYTFAAARPTAGVFQVNGLGELDIAWGYGAWTRPVSDRGELRLFALGYGDGRALVKADNRPLAVTSGADVLENIAIATYGGHYLRAVPTPNHGTLDFLFWGAAQAGSWGLQDHRAAAVAAEAGWQPKSDKLKPWLRLGYYFGSGDGDANDNTHGTFFPVLPTPRQYARYPIYNAQNNHDVSAMLILRPDPRITVRSEGHFLWLASKNDLWYSGGGAFSRGAFGYAGRPSNGERGLANVWDASLEYRPSPYWTFTGYYAHAWGGDVVKRIYPAGSNSNFGYVELEFRF